MGKLCFTSLKKDNSGEFFFDKSLCNLIKGDIKNKLGHYVYIKKYKPKMFQEFYINKYKGDNNEKI